MCSIPLAFSLAGQEPLTLEVAFREAMSNNLDLAAERLNVSVAETREITARLRPNPILSISGQTLSLLGTRYFPASPAGPNQMNVRTELPIERGGKLQERAALARQEITLTELGVREFMRQVLASVQDAYVDTQRARLNLDLARENLKHLEELVKINEARLVAGDLALVELERSRVAAIQYRTAVQQAQLALDQAKLQLLQVLGRRTKALDFDVSAELRQQPSIESRQALGALARQRRPDLLGIEQARSRSRADLRLQIANAKVDFSIGAEVTRQWAYGFTGNSLGLYFSSPLPVFNRNQGEIARAEREIRLGAARFEAASAAIETEVEKAFLAYTVSRRLAEEIERDLLARARIVRETTEYSYRRGEASLVEFLDAQRAFNDAMLTYHEARANYARSLYRLDTVTAATISGS